jgi:hypothetical protein
MALVANNVRVGVTGAVFRAPAGTALPTTATGALDTGFWDVGYISSDGVTLSTSTDTNDIQAWQNGDITRTVQTSHSFTVQFTMLETNETTLGLYFNAFTHGAGAASGVAQVKGVQGYRGEFVINMTDGTQTMRLVLPDAQVTDRGDITIVNGDAIQYQVTLTAYPDGSGNKAYLYFEMDAAS